MYLGHCKMVKITEDVLVVLPTGYGLIMANIKIFQLLPDVYTTCYLALLILS
jgi:hypothetical protein